MEVQDLIPAISARVAGALLSKIAEPVAIAIRDFAADPVRKALDEWQKAFGSGPDEAEAFAEFFLTEAVDGEFRKILDNRYPEVDYDLLVNELRSIHANRGLEPSFRGETDVWLDKQIRGLVKALGAIKEFRKEHQTALLNAVQDLGKQSAPIRNHSLARNYYLRALAKHLRTIDFEGFEDEVAETSADCASIFVMPTLEPHQSERKAATADEILFGREPPRAAVILGGPGSGKTMLLRYLSLGMARNDMHAFPWIEGKAGLLPVFIRIREFEPWLGNNSTGTLFQFMDSYFGGLFGAELQPGFFRTQDERSGLFVMVDGMDEAPTPARRRKVKERVDGLVGLLAPESRIAVTSRPLDYTLRFDDFDHFTLRNFDGEQIQELLHKWNGVHRRHDPQSQRSSAELGRLIRDSNEAVKDLAAIPLLLTLIARLHFYRGTLPNNRLDLYQKASAMLMETWASVKGVRKSAMTIEQKEEFLIELALRMQGRIGEEENREAALLEPRQTLESALKSYLRENGIQASAKEMVDSLHKFDAILVNYGDSRFGFIHRSFQEYFAACGILKHHEDVSPLFADTPAGWEETLSLAYAQIPPTAVRHKLIADLLRHGRAPFALKCVTAGKESDWLVMLVRLFRRCYWVEGTAFDFDSVQPAEYADLCGRKKESLDFTRVLLEWMFQRENREGRDLYTAVELAGHLQGLPGCKALGAALASFLGEASKFERGLGDEMVSVTPGDKQIAPFEMGKYPVTNKDFERMIPGRKGEREKGEYSSGDDEPVIYVNWYEADLYCRWLGNGSRLPTEDEWFQAASYDPKTRKHLEYPWGSDPPSAERCNVRGTGPGRTTPVTKYGKMGESPWGCCDMAGNVWEWTDSWYDEDRDGRSVRGGSWNLYPDSARCDFRLNAHPALRDDRLGFRVARTK